jgi:predicted transcriptional regulator
MYVSRFYDSIIPRAVERWFRMFPFHFGMALISAGASQMDELKLYYFRSVCRHLSFTRAAKACNVVQSTISKQIAALEDELGVKLFHRQNKGIQLTPAGRRLLRTLMPTQTSIERLTQAYVG